MPFLRILYILFVLSNSVEIYGQEYMGRCYIVVYLISYPYSDSSASLFMHRNPYDPLLSIPIKQELI